MDSNKRSKFEDQCAEVLEKAGFAYEPFQLRYNTERGYTPDFVVDTKEGQLLIECKGWFRPGDRQKYKAIRDQLRKDGGQQFLAFLLMNPAKKCQKGGKLTMAGWCNKEGFPWFGSAEGVVNYALDNQ